MEQNRLCHSSTSSLSYLGDLLWSGKASRDPSYFGDIDLEFLPRQDLQQDRRERTSGNDVACLKMTAPPDEVIDEPEGGGDGVDRLIADLGMQHIVSLIEARTLILSNVVRSIVS